MREEMLNKIDNGVISGIEFDEPLFFKGNINAEPERYVAEKPYELTKYEFSLLRKKNNSDLLFQFVASATVGFAIALVGKIVGVILNKQSPNIEKWEMWALIVGLLLSLAVKFFIKTKDDEEKMRLESNIERHFSTNKPRRIHLTKGEAGK